MSINLKMPHPEPDLKPRITVIGVGGAGGNAVNNMIAKSLGGVEFVACNTDAQALAQSSAERKIQLGRNITQGLGAGSRPDVGRAAAEEAIEDIIEQIQNSNMVFITAGMGGGTGTGAAPVLARAAREQGILTVGVVTKPFQFEGLNRMRLAEDGINELQHYVDTLIIIPNQNLFRIANEKTTFAEAFQLADNVLYSGVRGVTDLMVMPGLINLDFADVRQVMSEMGKAMMGTGEAEGENRAIAAAEAAISNPLLDDVSMQGAKGVLINITGGYDMTLFEVDEAANRIRSEVDPDANIIFGSTFDESLEGRMRISVIATGIDAEVSAQPKPRMISLVTDNSRVREALRQATQGGPGIAIPPRAQPLNAAMGAAINAAVLDLDARDQLQAQPIPRAEAVAPRPDVAAERGIDAAAEKPFMPPPPMVAPETAVVAQPTRRPDPMAEAELMNAGRVRPAAEPRRGLLARVTGAGKGRSLFGYGDDPAAKPVVEPSFAAGRSATKAPPAPPAAPTAVRAPQPTPAAPATPAPAPRPAMVSPAAQPVAEAPKPEAKPVPAQAALGGLEPQPVKDRDIGEDLLEIPAFLRRQAN